MKVSENVTIEVLQAGYGDCIFISVQKEKLLFNILIDGGLTSAYYNARERRNPSGVLKILLDKLKADDNHIDLLICTHVDDDHIGGIRKWFEMAFPTKDFLLKITPKKARNSRMMLLF